MYRVYFVLMFLTCSANELRECVICHSEGSRLRPIGYIHKECTSNALCDLCGSCQGDVRVFMIGAHRECLKSHNSQKNLSEKEEIRLAMLLAYMMGHEDGEKQQHCFRFWKILNAINSTRIPQRTLDFVRNFFGREIKIKDHEA